MFFFGGPYMDPLGSNGLVRLINPRNMMKRCLMDVCQRLRTCTRTWLHKISDRCLQTNKKDLVKQWHHFNQLELHCDSNTIKNDSTLHVKKQPNQ